MKTTTSEIKLFDHAYYGEGFLGMACHVREMSQLDRMIFEECTVADEAVVAPHLNVKSQCPVHLRPEIIRKRLSCTMVQAVALVDAWSIIEVTPSMVDAFVPRIKAEGIDEAIAYFEQLAVELAEVEVSWDCEILDLDPDAGDPFQEEEEEEYREEIPDLYAYHVIGYDELAEALELTWEERQPRSYKALLRQVRGMDDIDALRALGKKVYALNLSREQAGVFWYEYGKSQGRIMDHLREGLGASARRIVQQIENANGNLAALGARLYRIQRGEITMADPPAKHEWIIIWEAYHGRRAAVRP